MTTFEYLNNKLSLLSNTFNIIVKYYYNNKIHRHIIVLTPQKEYYNNSKLDDCWISISLEFMELFPDDTISFVSDDSTLISDEYLMTFNDKEFENICIDKFYFKFLNHEIKVKYVPNFELDFFSQNLFSNIKNQIKFKKNTFSYLSSFEINYDKGVTVSTEEYIYDDSNDQLPQAA